jgi:hypothetical protein
MRAFWASSPFRGLGRSATKTLADLQNNWRGLDGNKFLVCLVYTRINLTKRRRIQPERSTSLGKHVFVFLYNVADCLASKYDFVQKDLGSVFLRTGGRENSISMLRREALMLLAYFLIIGRGDCRISKCTLTLDKARGIAIARSFSQAEMIGNFIQFSGACTGGFVLLSIVAHAAVLDAMFEVTKLVRILPVSQNVSEEMRMPFFHHRSD